MIAGMIVAALAGCGASGSTATIHAPIALRGIVLGGDTPISAAKVQLYAAGTSGSASAAVALLNAPVQTESDGSFAIPASYVCPSASSQIYVVARGGRPGLPTGGENPSIALAALLGACENLPSHPVAVNEVTTIGFVWPMAPYLKSSTEFGSAAGDALFPAAVASIPQYINPQQGSSPGIATTDSYFAQSAKLYSLANVLDKCVNSAGGVAGDGTPCGLLFSMAAPAQVNPPADTMAAAVRIAQSPYTAVSAIYNMARLGTAFLPALTAVPDDWTLLLSHPVATPVISPATGTYTGTQTVTISDATAGSKIFYTTDGTMPGLSSALYKGPITLSVTSTLQAVAVEGVSQSSLVSSTLTIASVPSQPMAAKLAFLQGPSSALVGSPIAPAVQVVVEDQNGAVVASANNAVTISLVGAGELGSTLQAVPQNGIATFSNLSVDAAGEYTLAANSAGLSPATSTPFAITAPSVTGVASKLVFLQQPSNMVAGATMTPSVTVAVEDANGDVVTNAANPVTLALAVGTGLGGNVTATPVDGIATFATIRVATSGTGYVLTAGSAGLVSGSSTSFVVTAAASPVGAATARLAFVQQPSNGMTGTPITPSVTVAVEDANGNIVSSAGNAVTLALTNGAGLMGTLTAAPSYGIATFSNLTVSTAETDLMLSATSAGLTSATSAAFTIAAPAVIPTATRLVFRQQPSNTVAGAAISPAVTVALEDSSGNVVPAAGNPVTVALATGTGLTGTHTVTPVNGIATFSTLSIATAATGDELAASSPGFSTVHSTSFAVSPANQTVGIMLSPATASVVLGGTKQLTASVTGASNSTVTWTVSGNGCTGSGCGTVSPAGLYTGPPAVPNSATVTITATSVADGSKSASATLTLVPAQATGYGLAWEDTFSRFGACTTDVAGCNWYNPGVYQWDAGGAVTNPSNSYVNLQWSPAITGGNFPNISTASSGGKNYRAWTFGYFEVRMAFDPAAGSWPGIWMAPTQTIGSPSNNGAELDNFEWQSNTPSTFYGTLHVWQNGADQTYDNQNTFSVPAGTDFSVFHTYGVLWTKTTVTWYFDNQRVGSFDITQSPYNSVFAGQQSLYLILGQQSGCNWKYSQCGGQVSPLNMKVDWVHVYAPPSSQ
jgi:Glycosyl hydrolases family 16/Chitobiase/beta-hexosaminidase C-terminal domain